MPDVKTYDPGLYKMSLKGISILGCADDMIEIEFDEDEMTDQAGAQGDVVVTRNRNKLATITFHLLAESTTNDRLSAMADVGRVSPLFYGPFTMKNTLGTTLVHAARAWIAKRPTLTQGKESTPREWKVRAVIDTYNVGGTVV